MNFKKIAFALCFLGLTSVFVGCGEKADNKSTADTAVKNTAVVTTQAVETTEPTTQVVTTEEVTTEPVTEKPTEALVLSNTYKTRFSDVTAVTYPTFAIDYPDNWSISESNADVDGENFTLTNGNGAQIIFRMLPNVPEDANLGAASRAFSCVTAKKVADSSFVPSMVQGTDYSSLGKFAVLKLRVTKYMHANVNTDYVPVEDNVTYAVSPETNIGEKRDIQGVMQAAYSFRYASLIMIYADDTDNDFTAQEQKEAIKILKSFRIAD